MRSAAPGRCLRHAAAGGREGVLKRAFDVALSGTGLLISAPLWLLIAAAVTLEDGGTVLFVQDRVGIGGAPFPPLKFRSTVPPASSPPPPQARADDPRVQRIRRPPRAPP